MKTGQNAKVALVTGASSDIGRAIALALSDAGYDIAIHYNKSQIKAQSLRSQLPQSILLPCDLNQTEIVPTIIHATIKHFGRLDVLVNNASVFRDDKHYTNRWEETLNINLIAPMTLCYHAEQYVSHIINICDIIAERPWKHHVSYAVSKSGLATLTRALAIHFAPRVRVNAVSPGFISGGPSEYLKNRIPLGRNGTPDEVAEVVRFLVESSGFITGQIISVDGGRLLQ